MKLCWLIALTFSFTLSLGQAVKYVPTSSDTLITCSLTKRDTISGPFSTLHSTEFENLVVSIFKTSPFPPYPFTVFRSQEPAVVQLGCLVHDNFDYQSFFLYNLDSVMELNLKARSKFGLMTLIAHEAGHHVFHHLVPPRSKKLHHQELQADYFAGWILAHFNAPRGEITKGLSVLASENLVPVDYPPMEERYSAILLGYDIGRDTTNLGPLKLLEEKRPINMEWIKKWCRTVALSPMHSQPSDGIFAGQAEHFALDVTGQLIYNDGNQHYVIASTIPSKDRKFKYLLFDSQLSFWWIANDGTIHNSSGANVIGHVNLNLLEP